MTDTFESLYAPLLKEIFTEQARQQILQGVDALTQAREYANLGKPDFALAFLLLSDQSDEEKREVLALSYEQRAALSTKKANEYSVQFHRPFPLIKLEARKDLQVARAIRQGENM